MTTIEIRYGFATVTLDAQQTRLLGGARTVNYEPDDLLRATVQVLMALGDPRAADVKKLLGGTL